MINILKNSMQYFCSEKQPPEVFCKNDVLENFANFLGKHLCWSLFSIKLQAFISVTLLKRDFNTGVFCWILRKFKERLFWWTSVNDCFYVFPIRYLYVTTSYIFLVNQCWWLIQIKVNLLKYSRLHNFIY